MKLKKRVKMLTEEELIECLGLPKDSYVLQISMTTTFLQGGSELRKFAIEYLTVENST